jgi:hypothetical protein
MPHISTTMRTVSKGSAKPAWALFQVGWLTLVITSPVALATEPPAKSLATKVSLIDGRWRLNGELTYRGANDTTIGTARVGYYADSAMGCAAPSELESLPGFAAV